MLSFFSSHNYHGNFYTWHSSIYTVLIQKVSLIFTKHAFCVFKCFFFFSFFLYTCWQYEAGLNHEKFNTLSLMRLKIIHEQHFLICLLGQHVIMYIHFVRYVIMKNYIAVFTIVQLRIFLSLQVYFQISQRLFWHFT